LKGIEFRYQNSIELIKRFAPKEINLAVFKDLKDYQEFFDDILQLDIKFEAIKINSLFDMKDERIRELILKNKASLHTITIIFMHKIAEKNISDLEIQEIHCDL
jgi:hypothetical protein